MTSGILRDVLDVAKDVGGASCEACRLVVAAVQPQRRREQGSFRSPFGFGRSGLGC